VENALAYYDTEFTTAVKRFKVEETGLLPSPTNCKSFRKNSKRKVFWAFQAKLLFRKCFEGAGEFSKTTLGRMACQGFCHRAVLKCHSEEFHPLKSILQHHDILQINTHGPEVSLFI
jgi:hypothetical protein